MEGNNIASDQVIAELIGMGFEFSEVTEAIDSVGLSLDAAIDFILNGSHRNSRGASSSSKCSTSSKKTLGKRALPSSSSFGRMRQPSLVEHLQSAGRPKRSKNNIKPDARFSGSEVLPRHVEVPSTNPPLMDTNVKGTLETSISTSYCQEEDIGPDWEHKVKTLLQKQFGYSSLKSFQKEALSAWLAHQDCLVLAATGSGIYIPMYFSYFCYIFGLTFRKGIGKK